MLAPIHPYWIWNERENERIFQNLVCCSNNVGTQKSKIQLSGCQNKTLLEEVSNSNVPTPPTENDPCDADYLEILPRRRTQLYKTISRTCLTSPDNMPRRNGISILRMNSLSRANGIGKSWVMTAIYQLSVKLHRQSLNLVKIHQRVTSTVSNLTINPSTITCLRWRKLYQIGLAVRRWIIYWLVRMWLWMRQLPQQIRERCLEYSGSSSSSFRDCSTWVVVREHGNWAWEQLRTMTTQLLQMRMLLLAILF